MRKPRLNTPNHPKNPEPRPFLPLRLLTAALAAALAPVLVGSPAMAQTAPDAPIITSEDFTGGSSPSDGEPTPMLGEVGTLTITTTDLDT